MTAIKVCGIKKIETYNLLLELKVKWAGLVFYPHSPRYITPKQAQSFPDYKDEGLLKVGLFVKPTLEEISRVMDKVQLDVLQLYTSPENAQIIQETYKLPVWIAQGVTTKQDLPQNCHVDGMVIEAPSYSYDSIPGGNGRAFDWCITKEWKAPKPWLLAGGLTPENVNQAIKQSGARAVDVSSGVEHYRGEKDPALIREFVRNIHGFGF